jgi:hypothetical protein
MVIGQTVQVIFFTSSVTICNVPANKVKGSATRALSKAKRLISNFIVNKTVVRTMGRLLGKAPGPRRSKMPSAGVLTCVDQRRPIQAYRLGVPDRDDRRRPPRTGASIQ